jgi:hypothetical protein
MWLSSDIIVIDNITNYKPAQAYSTLERGYDHIPKIDLENTYRY